VKYAEYVLTIETIYFLGQDYQPNRSGHVLQSVRLSVGTPRSQELEKLENWNKQAGSRDTPTKPNNFYRYVKKYYWTFL